VSMKPYQSSFRRTAHPARRRSVRGRGDRGLGRAAPTPPVEREPDRSVAPASVVVTDSGDGAAPLLAPRRSVRRAGTLPAGSSRSLDTLRTRATWSGSSARLRREPAACR
jgi:hypothetical protein